MRSEYSTIIVGSGPTGLSAAYHLDEDYLILEKEAQIGGLNRSITINGFTFDHAGHILFTNDEYARQMFNRLLGDNVHYQLREAWCYQCGVHTMYPFQANTYGLPREVIRDCVSGMARAYLKYGDDDPKSYRSFEEWIYKTYGDGIARHFMVPYNQRLWKVPLSEMSHDWLSGRVPMPKVEEIIEGAIRPGIKNMGPNAHFGYPLRGGFQALVDGWRNLLDVSQVRTRSEVACISLQKRRVVLQSGEEIGFRRLVSTMPLPELVRRIENIPQRIRDAGESLNHTSILCVFIGLDRGNITDKHWIYYPELDLFFHRIFVQGNASPFNQPPNCSNYIAEISYRGSNVASKDVAIEKTLASLEKVGLKAPHDRVLVADAVYLPYAYVIPQWHKDAAIRAIKDFLGEHDIYTVGRFGEWAYYNTDHSILSGKRAADAINEKQRKHRVASAPRSAKRSQPAVATDPATVRAAGTSLDRPGGRT
ncbi:MAG: NAD(P)-binding protein [Armatimonadetes bacterium]|nr:NAD(P)-binding protein [Armatimonadota bacterium]